MSIETTSIDLTITTVKMLDEKNGDKIVNDEVVGKLNNTQAKDHATKKGLTYVNKTVTNRLLTVNAKDLIALDLNETETE